MRPVKSRRVKFQQLVDEFEIFADRVERIPNGVVRVVLSVGRLDRQKRQDRAGLIGEAGRRRGGAHFSVARMGPAVEGIYDQPEVVVQ